MKIILTFLVLCGTFSAKAQSEKFLKAMQSNLDMMDSSFSTTQSLVSLANSFERIGNAEKKEWLPFYYAAFLQVNNAFRQTDKSMIDAVADKAEQLINKADSLSPMNSEISCIKSMVATCRLMVDPMSRFMEYGQLSEKHLEEAMKSDTTNPRPYFLRGQSLKYTPEQFGGGCKKAMPVLETAKEKYAAFIPASPIHPDWGKAMTEKVLQECK